METIRLYYNDPYQKTFTAQVMETRENKKGQPQVRLSQTCFYPEGGGQPFDIGTLTRKLNAGSETVKVIETHEDGDEIWHTLSAPLETGDEVEGEIDWERRFDLMQQHSGEHILSGILNEMTGCDNVGFHLSEESVTVDLNKLIGMDTLIEAESRVNRYIWEDHASEISFPDRETLGALSYRSKKELSGEVRIVSFPGADVCACCGTHVARSGEIGQVKVLSVQNWKGGVRVEIACGKRALKTERLWMSGAQEAARLLSVKPAEIYDAVKKLSDELSAARIRISSLEDRAFAKTAEEYAGKGNVLVFEDGLSADGVRRLCAAITERCGGRCAVFSGTDGEGYKYAIGEKDGDLRTLTKELNAALSGRGGGKPFFSQGSAASTREEIERFFETR